MSIKLYNILKLLLKIQLYKWKNEVIMIFICNLIKYLKGGGYFVEDYKRIDLFDLLHIIAKKIWLVILLVIGMATLAAYASENWIETVYEGESVLFIGKSKTNTTLSLDNYNLDGKLLLDYQQLIMTRHITEYVINDYKLNISTEDFRERMSIEALDESRFIAITYRDSNPEKAAIITNYLATTLVKKASEVLGIGNLVIIDYAVVPIEPISPIIELNIAVGALVGSILSIIILLIEYRFDRRIKYRYNLENFGITVMGFIPKHFKDREQQT